MPTHFCHSVSDDYLDYNYDYYYPSPLAPEGAAVPINSAPSTEPRPLEVEVELQTGVDGVLECRVHWQAGRPQEYVVRWERQACRGCGLVDPQQRMATVVQSQLQVSISYIMIHQTTYLLQQY